MPVHDWTRVTAGTFHDFHNRWITHLTEALNEGLLPAGLYAQSEVVLKGMQPDVTTLAAERGIPVSSSSRGTAIMTPPQTKVYLRAEPNAVYRLKRRTVVIRNSSRHQVVAFIEIVSPANKDRAENVQAFSEKVFDAISAGVHVLLIDLFPPSRSNPSGLHAIIWKEIEPLRREVSLDRPLCLASYEALDLPEAFIEPLSVGDVLPDMPLFYEEGLYVQVPLEKTYDQAWRGVPGIWKDVIEGRRTVES